MQVFGSLKQRVLWKWDKDTMDDLPPNVRLGKWLPQQDILGEVALMLIRVSFSSSSSTIIQSTAGQRPFSIE